MCGLAGMLGPGGADTSILERMSRCLVHRGPDGDGMWTAAQDDIGLSHQRLAVLGLGEVGAQPMVSASGRFVLAYNGEIYNHLELRDELATAGRAPTWRGGSDTETLLAGVDAWGLRGLLPRLVGMFALALWDRERRTLTLARDRMGEKPLSYAWSGATLLFASQPSSLHTVPGFDPPIDRRSLAGLLRYAVIPGDAGIHEGVRKLPPGTLLEVRAGSLPGADSPRPEPYWSFDAIARAGTADPTRASPSEVVDLVDDAVLRAVRSQMLADVPVGAFLSGGVDSSLVVATMQRVTDRPVRTFTIGFEDDRRDESAYARAVANHLGTAHTEMRLSAREAQEIIPTLPSIYDEPFADSSQIPTILVSRLAREHVTVALSGDGGDELFAGYTRYPQAEWLRRVPRIVGMGAAAVYGLRRQRRRASLGRTVVQGEEAIVRRLLSSNAEAERLVLGVDEREAEADFHRAWVATSGLGGLTARSMALDTTRYLNDDILHKVDRAAMSVSLETRVPLLDHRLVELAWRIPMDMKFAGYDAATRRGARMPGDQQGKWVLRELLARHVPRELFERPKAGFSVPIGEWLSGPLRPWAEDLLRADDLRADGLLDVERVRRLWSEHTSGVWNAGSELWPILMFQAWNRTQCAARRSASATG